VFHTRTVEEIKTFDTVYVPSHDSVVLSWNLQRGL